jgi:HEPN superfamily RiboL-PSP-like protein
MHNHELQKQVHRIQRLIKQVKDAAIDDLELQSHWGQYICILVAGFMESAIANLYGDFTKAAASKPVSDFTSSILEKIRNPKASRFIDLARAFNPTWAEQLEKFANENNRKEALDSIMRNRNLIAHGRSTSISIGRVNEYFEKCIEIVDFIEGQCGGK